jgi:hypothetical protein
MRPSTTSVIGLVLVSAACLSAPQPSSRLTGAALSPVASAGPVAGSVPGRPAAVPSSAPSNTLITTPNPLCQPRASLPDSPRVSFVAGPKLDPWRNDPPKWQQQLVDAMWHWTVIEATGLPAVSEEGRSVRVLQDARPFTGPPRFEIQLIEKDVDRARPDRVMILLTDREFSAALPSWPEDKSGPPEQKLEAFLAADSRFARLQATVRARIERAKAEVSARRWVPLSWCQVNPSDAEGAPGRIEDLTVTISPPSAKRAPSIEVRNVAGSVLLDRGDPGLVARSHPGRWGQCTYRPSLSLVAVDQARKVLVVLVAQVGSNDSCDTVPTVHAYRLSSHSASESR